MFDQKSLVTGTHFSSNPIRYHGTLKLGRVGHDYWADCMRSKATAVGAIVWVLMECGRAHTLEQTNRALGAPVVYLMHSRIVSGRHYGT